MFLRAKITSPKRISCDLQKSRKREERWDEVNPVAITSSGIGSGIFRNGILLGFEDLTDFCIVLHIASLLDLNFDLTLFRLYRLYKKLPYK